MRCSATASTATDRSGIELGAWDGVTPNDADDGDSGPNALQNFPRLTLARTNGVNQLTLNGTLDSSASTWFRIEFFANTAQDGSGYGEGQTFLGSALVQTDINGDATIATTLTANVAAGSFISATATQTNVGETVHTNTSEFARNVYTLPLVQGALVVDTTNDVVDGDATSISTLLANKGADGFISLREAVIASNNTSGNDTLNLAAGTYTLTIAGAGEDGSLVGDIDVQTNITIAGAGMASTIISGGGIDRPIEVDGSGNLTLSDVRLTGGSVANDGGALLVEEAGGTATLTRVDITGNTITGGGRIGGGIHNVGTLVMTDSLVHGNTATGSDGGGISNLGTATLTRSSIFSNSARYGGGIHQLAGSMAIENLTISGNTASAEGGGIDVAAGTLSVKFTTVAANTAVGGNGGGVMVRAGALTIGSSIFADNTSASGGRDLHGTVTSLGYNVIEHNAGFSGTVATDLLGTDPALAALALDAASGQYLHALNSGSIAIDLGGVAPPPTDQRNATRDGSADAGAYERLNSAPVLDASGTMTFATITEDDTNNAGALVSTLIASAGGDRITDADGDPEGIAITATADGNGSWEYSLDGGGSWYTIGAVTNASALLLRSSDRVRFVPNANDGTTGSITFRAWDRKIGSAGTKVSTATNGGSSAFSTATESASITVTAVNDAPVATNLNAAQTYTEDTQLDLSDIVISDVNSANVTATLTLSNVAAGSLNTATSGSVTSTYAAGIWSASGAVADVNSLLAGLTFTPSLNFNSAFTIATSVSDGVAAPITGSKAMTGTPVNDAPVITSNGGGAGVSVGVAENSTAVTTVTSSDVDGGAAGYSILAGGDAVRFTINPTTGVLSFLAAPDHENPTDGGLDNVYNLTVQVSDGSGGTDTQAIAVTVADVADGIRITPISVVPIGSETVVNTNTGDIQTINPNVAQAVATDAAGNFVVVWASNLQDGSGYGVYAQRFAADGTAQNAEFLVTTNTADNQIGPTIGMDAAGNFVVTWASNLQDGSGYGIYAQHFNAAGAAQGAEFLVNTTVAGSQSTPAIAMSPSGAFVITWTGGGQDPDGSSGIYAQRFDASGVAQGGEFRVNSYTTNTQQLTSVGIDDAGNFVIIWASLNQDDGASYGVYGQRFDAAGVAQGAEFRVNTTTANSQLYHDVAMLGDGRFVVTFQSRNADNSFEVYLQRYAADGSALGGETRVNTNTVSSAQQPIPSITADASGITVVWNSAADGSGVGIAGQRFDWSGTALGGEFQVNTTTAGNQLYPEVVAQPGGGFVVAWSGNGAGDADGVFLQRYGLTTTEAGGTATFSVVLEAAPTADVVITVGVPDGTEGTVSVASLTFTSANWNIAQTVAVTGVQDYSNDGNAAYTVVLGSAISADLNFNGLNPADLSVTNLEVPNVAPVNTVPVAQSVNEDMPLVFSAANGNAIAISDTDAGGNAMQVTLSVTNGVLTLGGVSGLGFSSGANGSAAMTFTGSIAAINTALSGLRFDPTANFSGPALLTLNTNDLGNSGTGVALSDTDAVAIAVNPVNDAPSGAPLVTGTATEDQTLTANTAAIADADGLGAFSYQWQRNASNIGGATASTYTLGDADVGTNIRVVVGYTDAHGTAESLTSAAVGPVANVNDAPVITPIAPDVTFVEGGSAQVIDATGTIVDVDSANFDGGVLTVSVSANGTADDRLAVGNWGTGPGQVGVAGSDVTYEGTVIGSVSGGTSGSDPLVVVFNTSATSAAVQEVYRSIQFGSASDAPATATRQLTIGLTDGDGGTATPRNKLVYVQAVNDAPVVTFGEGNKNFTEGALAVMIDALPSVSDPDSANFDTGTLTITISANATADDRVELLNTGMGAGQIGVSGTSVYYGGVLIGTQGGGIGAAPFVVTFNASANATVVGEVMANIRFWVVGDAPSTLTRSVEAVLTDGDGGTSVTAAKLITVTAANDAPTGAPVVSGTPTEDQILTASTASIADTDGLGVFSYQWQRNGVAIGGATGSAYTLGDADVGASIRVIVSYTDGNGTAESLTSAAVGPVANVNDAPSGAPIVTGTTTEDQTLTANTAGIADADGLGAFSYQWQRNGSGIAGATGSTYLLGDADVGANMRVVVSWTDGNGTAESLTSAAVGPVANVNDAPSGAPVVTGTPTEDQTLGADTSSIADADGLGAFSYQWQRNGANIAGATASTYTLGDADVGTIVHVVVSYTDGNGTAESLSSTAVGPIANVNDAPTGAATIDDTTPTQGQTLVASNTLADADGLGVITYTWQADGSTVGTGSTYVVTEAEVGKVITVIASYTDGHGTAEAVTSVATAAVANINDAPTGSVTIDDTTPTQGQTLTASDTLADADGLGVITYTWQADGATVGTGGTYVVTEAEVGKVITVIASYTDGHGTAEAVSSAATAAVVNVNDAPTGSVTINDTTPTQGQTLTASNTLADADGLGAITYTWQADGATVGTGGTYVVTEAEVGKVITVIASYTDGHGTAEAVSSAATAAVANVNDAPTGSVTIDDTTPTQGQTLTASNTLADADGLGVITYTWQANGATVGTGSTYLVTEAEVGKVITVTASYTDGHGTAEAVTSVATAAVANINDAPTGSVTIDDTTPTQGQTLTVSNTLADPDGLGAITYTWRADGASVGTGSTYVVTEAEVGKVISVVASYTDGHGTSESVSSAATAAVANVNDAPTGNVTIDDTTPTQGQTLTASNTLADADGLGAITYTWQADGSTVGTGGTYVVTEAEVGKVITVTASYTDGHGTSESIASAATAAVANVNDAPTGAPVVSGTPTEDQTLAADTSAIADADGLGTFSYQWQRNGSNVAGATSSAYTLGDADVGATIRVVVSYTDARGTAESLTSAAVGPVANVDDAPVGTPVVTGTAAEDQTLTADTSSIADADGLGAFSYQWQRNGSNVAGATGSTYTLGDADVGTTVRVVVSYTDGQGTAESLTSVAVGPVANVNDAPSGAPVVTGAATEDQTLSADTTSIADADGLGAFSYQWQRNGANVAGATASTYTLGDADVGATIRVIVSYIDARGTAESLTSAAVGPVANVNDVPSGAPVVSGAASEDQVLTADASSIADADGVGALSYQWQRNGANIAGATSSTYTLGDADVGASIRVVVSYTDGGGTSESMTSAAVGPIANVNDAPSGAPVVSGAATEDQTLSADTSTIADADGLGAFSFQWQRNGVNVAGATASTYTLGDADVGTTIRVVVSYTDGNGTAESLTSAALGPVANVNDAPVITSDGGNATAAVGVAENQAAVTTVTSSDVDGGIPAYTIMGGADAAHFAIDAASGALRFATAPDFEAPSDADLDNIYRLVVGVDDGNGGVATQAIAVAVSGINEAPGNIAPAAALLTEQASAGTVVAIVTASDPDAGDLFTFTLVNDGNGRFVIDPSSGRLTVAAGAVLDFETAPSHTLLLRVTDAQGLRTEQQIVVTLRDVAEALPVVVPPTTPTPPLPPSVVFEPVPAPSLALPPTNPAPPTERESAGGRDAPEAPASRGLVGAARAGAQQQDEDAGSARRTYGRPLSDDAPVVVASVSFGARGSAVGGWSDAVLDGLLMQQVGDGQAPRFGLLNLRGSSLETEAGDEASARGRSAQQALAAAVQDPVRVASATLTAGFVWWLTRSGGLLTSILMGIPAWRHVDLLPVLAPAREDEDDDGLGADSQDDDAEPDRRDSLVDDLFSNTSRMFGESRFVT